MDSQIAVTPVKTGVQEFHSYLNQLDSDWITPLFWRGRNDENGLSATFCQTVTFNTPACRTTIKAESVPVKFKNFIKT